MTADRSASVAAHEPENKVVFVPNLPNVLSLARIALVPVFIVVLVQGGTAARLWAFGIFLLAGITDKLDGHLARTRGQVTNFGKLTDSIADKFLTGAAFVMLSILGELPWWVTIVVLARELGITLMRMYMVRHAVLAAGAGGKVKMVLQIVGICLMLVPWTALLGSTAGAVLETISLVVMYAAAAVTVLTGLDYVLKAVRLSRERRS